MTRRMLAGSLLGPLALLAGALAGCGPTGGQVSVADSGVNTYLVFTAAGGQDNVVTVTENGAFVLVSDAGDTITPGDGCTRVDADTASCTRPDFLTMNLGDGDDEATNNTDYPSNLIVFGTEARGIRGGPGNDTLHGGSVADLLTGDEGRDVLDGNGGDDVLSEGATAATTDVLDVDTYEGGPGTGDIASYSAATQGVLVLLNSAADDGRSGEGDFVMPDVEHLTGGNGLDNLQGDADANILRGGGNNDTLVGNEGADTFFGEGGNDLLIEGGTATTTNVVDVDSFRGGEGTDRARYFASTIGVRIDLDDVADDGRIGEGDNVRADVENLDGGQAGDTLIGDADANRLTGQPGDDALDGLGGNDVLSGGTGFDKLDGGTETDDCDVGPDGGSEQSCET
jgi:Ca2+-binding RTX toxin-like protein